MAPPGQRVATVDGCPSPVIESPLAILIHPRRPGTVFIGGERGVFGTQDHGLSWTQLTHKDDGSVEVMASDPSNPDRIYAGTRYGGVLITEDAGVSWRYALPSTGISAIAVDYADPHQIFVGVHDFTTGRTGVMVSRDRGVTWTWISGLPLRDTPSAVAAHPIDTVRLYVASGTFNDAPYVTHLARARTAAAVSYNPMFASYLSVGKVGDLALTPGGETIVALSDAITRNIIIARAERIRRD